MLTKNNFMFAAFLICMAVTSTEVMAEQVQAEVMDLISKNNRCGDSELPSDYSAKEFMPIEFASSNTVYSISHSDLYSISKQWWGDTKVSPPDFHQPCSLPKFDLPAKDLFEATQSLSTSVADPSSAYDIAESELTFPGAALSHTVPSDQYDEHSPFATAATEDQASANFPRNGPIANVEGPKSNTRPLRTEALYENFEDSPAIEPYLVVDVSSQAALRSSRFHDDSAWSALPGRNVDGFGTQHFRRVGFGLGWTPNPGIKAKLEFGQDWFDGEKSSTLADSIENKNFVGLEIVSRF